MRTFLKLAGVLIALCATSPADAAIIEITYTGHVARGVDETGVFGTAGASLAGRSYVSTFLFDTSLGITSINDAFLPDNGSQRAEGGTDVSGAPTSPSLGSTFAIGGVVIALDGQTYGVVGSAAHETGLGSIYSDTSEFSDTVAARIVKRNGNEIDGVNFGLPPLLTPFTYAVLAGDSAFGTFVTYRYDYGLQTESEWAHGELTPETVTLRMAGGSPSPTPEPGVWALVVVGFGLAGAALRRRALA